MATSNFPIPAPMDMNGENCDAVIDHGKKVFSSL